MIELVISGGQTGADQAGWRAAKRFGIPTRGWMPKGFRTESGPHPDFAELYGAVEHESPEYPPRTRANAAEADVTFWFGRTGSPGYWCTRNAATQAFKPFWEGGGHDEAFATPEKAARTIRMLRYRHLNIAGNRESSRPEIGVFTETFLAEMFAILGHAEIQP